MYIIEEHIKRTGFYDFEKIQTFGTKKRPNKDPWLSKGLYYRPGSLNKDTSWHTVLPPSAGTASSYYKL